jgi:uncharacterized protein (DUF1501 family)
MKCTYACNSLDHRIARRHFLGQVAGGTGLLVSGFGPMVQPAAAASLARDQKRVVSIFLAGGSSQLETWDPKPRTDTGGPFRAIPTSVPGLHISELLPKTALQMHHLAVVRGLNTNENDHGLGRYLMETGRRQMASVDYPHLGAVTAKALSDESSPLPGHIHVSSGGGGSRRNDSAYLGAKYGSIVVGVDGGLRNSARPDGLTEDADRQRDMVRHRLNDHFARRRRTAETDAYAQSYDQARQLMERRQIFDVGQEPPGLLERYGHHELGKQCLLARRLLENGITFVQVSHSNYDTHNENFDFHLEQMAEFDQSFSALVEDLAQRGMLDSTLIIVMSEFGRTPAINQYYGRDHWGQAWSVVLGGCGIQRGAVIGKTNPNGTEVVDRQVDHRHLFHTYLRAVGLDSRGEFQIGGRSVPMADPAGEPIQELLA